MSSSADGRSASMAERFEFLFYPKIISGQCAMEHIPFELDGANAQKPLLIAGKESIGRGLAKTLIKAMYDSTVVIGAVYDAVEGYAGISQPREAADKSTGRFSAAECRWVLERAWEGTALDLKKVKKGGRALSY